MSANINYFGGGGTLRPLNRAPQTPPSPAPALLSNSSSMSDFLNGSTGGSSVIETIRKRMQQTKDELAKSQDDLIAQRAEREREKHTREQAEAELAGLNRRLQLVEEDLERAEERLTHATQKLDEASQAADESERKRLVLDGKVCGYGNRYDTLEQLLKETKQIGHMNDRKYEEVVRKLKIRDSELERTEDRAQRAEAKIAQFENEIKHLHYELRSKEGFFKKAMQREESYEEQIRDLTTRMKDTEAKAEHASRTMLVLQRKANQLQGDITAENLRGKSLQRDMDAMMSDLQNVL